MPIVAQPATTVVRSGNPTPASAPDDTADLVSASTLADASVLPTHRKHKPGAPAANLLVNRGRPRVM
jgi:hypothetical protein